MLKAEKRKSGQSVVILAALLLIPVAAIIQLSVSKAETRQNASIAVQAATSAAVATVDVLQPGSGTTEKDAVIAACQAMDPWLPAYLVSVSVADNVLRVVAAFPTENSEDVSHSFSVETAFGGSKSEMELTGDVSFDSQGRELARSVPECVGRAR